MSIPEPPSASPAPPGAQRADIQQKVNIPAIGLMVTGGLTIAGSLFGLVMKAFSGPPDFSSLHEIEGADQFIPILESMNSGAVGMLTTLIGLAVAALIIFGALKMRQLESWGLAVTACILSMIPCFTSCCCMLGLVFGIWGLVQLFNADVKAAFA
jgi:hypothetical protein